MMSSNLQAAWRTGLVMAVLAMGLVGQRVRAEDFVKSYPVTNRVKVHVDTNDASISVITSDANQVEFRVTYRGVELDKTLHIETHQQGDEVELSARVVGFVSFSFGYQRKVHIEVRMPKEADLELETADGSVEASALSGNISLHTHDGSIRANHLAGTIDLHSGDGSITVDTLSGNIRLRTGDGGIDGDGLDGKCEAISGDGHIHVTGRFDALKIRSGDGSITARAAQGSKMASGWEINTRDGSVAVALPSNFQADIDASSGDGRITLDTPITVQGVISKSQVHGQMNGGGQTLIVHTGDGSIHLKQS
jgi:hypothetical protein